MVWILVSTLLLIVLSAIFSGSEAAIFSLSNWQISELPGIRKMLTQPQRLLGTLLLGNLLVNTSATALFTLFLLQLSDSLGIRPGALLGLGGFFMTLVILIGGEITPKVIATRNPAQFARLIAPFIRITHGLFSPFTMLLERLSSLFAFLPRESPILTDEELHTMIELGREQGILLAGEEDILRNLLELDKRTVSEVMTPRSDIVAIQENASINDALQLCRRSGFSRIPIYAGNLEHITGVLYAKELLTAADPAQPVTTIARQPYFVPEVKRLSALLDELRRKNSHIAIVVDEFGQTAGLVTLEDILEALLGEISDEFDFAEELPYQKLGEEEYLVDGEIDFATLNRLFKNAFRSVRHERLSAFIHDQLGRLPRPGDKINLAGWKITVREVSDRKLEKVLIKRQD
jgi:CBS domain containing-hemolysin-like protein